MADLGFEPKSQWPVALTTVEAILFYEMKETRLWKGGGIHILYIEIFYHFHLKD